MAAHFKSGTHQTLEARALFVLPGEVVGGTVQTGMVARLIDGAEIVFEEPVHGVEFVDGRPALTFSYSRDEKLRRWQGIDWEGRTIELSWA